MPESADVPLSVPSEWHSETGGRLVRVLVIDDDPRIRELLVGALLGFGYLVQTASSAETALALLRDTAVELALCDVRLPGMDGVEFARFMAAAYPDVPVVLLTGFGDADLARSALRQGACDFLTKPLDIDTIPIVVARNLERGRLQRARIVEQEGTLRIRAIAALAAAIDAKQACTAEHSRRVSAITVALAGEMGLGPSDRASIELAAQVHDVGKIAVPDAVLDKDGPLTPDEWAVMRRHPGRGAEIVMQVEELREVARIVRHHHERIDGRGYPDGLREDDIPFLARVLAVADAYEAMTSDRPYRPRLGAEEAMARLRNGAGTQFDVAVVRAFGRLHERGHIPSR
ncbi:MAG: response regulator [Chthonomonadales bacterium]|nr:response regulator [Chthonomonadales bacterium]